MDLDLHLQRSFDRVELVSGTIGNPGDGKMCLMSLVAFLGGEEHSDSPECASPLIQAFAVRINDNMPHKLGSASRRLRRASSAPTMDMTGYARRSCAGFWPTET